MGRLNIDANQQLNANHVHNLWEFTYNINPKEFHS